MKLWHNLFRCKSLCWRIYNGCWQLDNADQMLDLRICEIMEKRCPHYQGACVHTCPGYHYGMILVQLQEGKGTQFKLNTERIFMG